MIKVSPNVDDTCLSPAFYHGPCNCTPSCTYPLTSPSHPHHVPGCRSMGLVQQGLNSVFQPPTKSSWKDRLTTYLQGGELHSALKLCQELLHSNHLHVDLATLVALLKACSKLKDLETGGQIHNEISRQGLLERHGFIASALVDMYGQCGSLAKAQQLFEEVQVQDVVSWTTIIKAFVEHGSYETALAYFDQMGSKGFSPDAITYACSLKACAGLEAQDIGKELHAELVKKGYEESQLVRNVLVNMYAKCNLLDDAKEVLENLAARDRVAWTALIARYADHGHGEEALSCLEKMQSEGIAGDAITYACSLKACGNLGAGVKGQEIHIDILKEGLDGDFLIGSTLVDMYAKCSLLAEALDVFGKLAVRNTIAWTSLITGYLEVGLGEEVLNHFELMQLDGVLPDAVTFVSSLQACSSLSCHDKGHEIHMEIVRRGLERDLMVGNALVDMYAKCGFLLDARAVFNMLEARDLVTWNSQIAGYVEQGQGQEVLNCFERMQREVLPDVVTLVYVLKACGLIGVKGIGQEIHLQVAKVGLEGHFFIGNTLVDMYTKFGSSLEAQKVFDKLVERDAVSWNALITGHAQLGDGEDVFRIFDEMVGEGIAPSMATLTTVLNACSHAGFVDTGLVYFKAMLEDLMAYYGPFPTDDLYNCLIDLFGRSGRIDKATAVIERMPHHPEAVGWHCLLGACQKWGNTEIGRQAFEHVLLLNEMNTAAYVTCSNVYASTVINVEATCGSG